MNSYLDLIPVMAGVRKKQSRMTRLCIVLAVFLVASVFGMAEMEIKSQKIQVSQSDGAWHAGFQKISAENAARIQSRPEVRAASFYGIVNYRLDEEYYLEGKKAGICGIDEAFLELFPSCELLAGSFPKGENQALVPEGVQRQLHLNVGDQVVLETPDQQKISYTISGIVKDLSTLTKYDAFCLFLNREAYKTALGEAEEDLVYYVQFSPFCNIQKAISEICDQLQIPAEEVSQNIKLLGLMLQSDDTYMLQLYATAAILAGLVTVAGILMITGSLNSSVAERTAFFGMLRCLGATPGQVRQFVRREALSWCKTAIPVGLALSAAVTCALCAALRFLSPEYFGSMPVLGISGMGMFSGTLVGLLTVLLAARSPAKRASGVSPLTAVSGNAALAQEIKRPAGSRIFPVEAALGIHHAGRNRKQFGLMAGSFALSIILFLAFTTAVDFMNHAVKPLQPNAPDLSVSTMKEACDVPRKLADTLGKHPAVERIYGRQIGFEIPVQTGKKERRVYLVSYEAYQFQWAEDMLLEGSQEALERAADGKSLLTVTDEENTIPTGTEVVFSGRENLGSIPVEGILASSPIGGVEGSRLLICSEKLFQQITGLNSYAVIDMQLKKTATEEDVEQIRALAGENVSFSDYRLGNEEIQALYYAFQLFLYGFLAVVAVIAMFNIINSIQMSVSAQFPQFGAMRAIGMSSGQLIQIVSFEAAAYGMGGIILGCAAGIPVNKVLYEKLVTFHWGTPWEIPVGSLMVIVAVIVLSVLLSVVGPAKKIKKMSVAETIHAQ